MTLEEQLHPSRFTEMSPKMAALVAYILEQEWTTPAFAEVCITSDACVLGRLVGDSGFNEFIGSAWDLEANWRNLLEAADLSEADRYHAESAYVARIKDWREVNA